MTCNVITLVMGETIDHVTPVIGQHYCQRERHHEGRHVDGDYEWTTMFHHEGDVCQICGDGPSDQPGNPRLRITPDQWVHIECDWDLRDEVAREWMEV